MPSTCTPSAIACDTCKVQGAVVTQQRYGMVLLLLSKVLQAAPALHIHRNRSRTRGNAHVESGSFIKPTPERVLGTLVCNSLICSRSTFSIPGTPIVETYTRFPMLCNPSCCHTADEKITYDAAGCSEIGLLMREQFEMQLHCFDRGRTK